MAWTVPSNRTTGDLVTAAIWNENLGADANSKILRDGGIAIASQAAGDVLYGSSATQLARLAIGTANKVLTSSGSVPQWVTQIANAALPTNVDLGGTLDVTGATTLDSTMSVAGIVGIGGAPDTYAAVTLRKAFTSSGSSSVARGLDTDRMTVTGVSGDTTHIVGSLFSAAMTVQNVSETVADVAQVMIDEPAITKGASATITNSSSLKITGAASEATNNYALWVDAGVSRFDGNVDPLEIVDAATSGGTLDVLKLTTSSTNDIAPRLLMEANRNSVVQQVAFFIEASTGAGAKLRISTDNTSGTLTDALAIDSSQLVGIGNTAPKSALHVSDASLHGNIHSGGNTTVLGSLFNHQSVSSGYLNITQLNNSGGVNARINLGFGVIASNVPTNTVMTLNQDGGVGIGVVPGSGEAKLHVNTTGNQVGFEVTQNVGGEIGVRITGGAAATAQALVIRNSSGAVTMAVTDAGAISASNGLALAGGVLTFKETGSAPASVATYGMLYALDDDTLGYRDGNGAAHILRYD